MWKDVPERRNTDMEIGKKLKDARMKSGFTQETVAEKINVSRQTISNWENEKSYPDIISDIIGFSEKMYDLWKLLPDKINNEEPFYTLNYAGDCLSYGDEIRCCELYKCALNYYEDNSNQYKEV